MDNKEKLLHEYTFATKKSIAIMGFLFFFGAGVVLGIAGWKEQSWTIAGLASLSIGMSLMGILGAKTKKKVRVLKTA